MEKHIPHKYEPKESCNNKLNFSWDKIYGKKFVTMCGDGC